MGFRGPRGGFEEIWGIFGVFWGSLRRFRGDFWSCGENFRVPGGVSEVILVDLRFPTEMFGVFGGPEYDSGGFLSDFWGFGADFWDNFGDFWVLTECRRLSLPATPWPRPRPRHFRLQAPPTPHLIGQSIFGPAPPVSQLIIGSAHCGAPPLAPPTAAPPGPAPFPW